MYNIEEVLLYLCGVVSGVIVIIFFFPLLPQPKAVLTPEASVNWETNLIRMDIQVIKSNGVSVTVICSNLTSLVK